MASFSSNKKMYVKIGTAKIEPPLPIRPSTIPINNAKPNPYNSIKIFYFLKNITCLKTQ